MADNYKGWLCEESLKEGLETPLPYVQFEFFFEFRGKSSLITVISMDSHSPNKFSTAKIKITSWKARAYGIFTRVGEVSEIERVSAANE